MAKRLAFDTCFLIDLEKELARGAGGPAHRFLAAQRLAVPCLSVTALGEFAEGFASASDPHLALVRRTFALLNIDDNTALLYGRLARTLRAGGKLIGTNDLWIAASALRHALPLVTNNTAHFRRIEGLQTLTY